MLICFLIMGALASGFAFMEIENRIKKLYIPQSSITISNLKKAKDYGFYRPSRQTEVIIINNNGTNVLTKECFQDALLLHEVITNISGYTDICFPKKNVFNGVVSSPCLTEEPEAKLKQTILTMTKELQRTLTRKNTKRKNSTNSFIKQLFSPNNNLPGNTIVVFIYD